MTDIERAETECRKGNSDNYHTIERAREIKEMELA
jgi:hypothetical protein